MTWFSTTISRRSLAVRFGDIFLGFSLIAAAPAAAAPNPQNGRSETTVVTLGTGGGPMVRTNRAQATTALIVRDRLYLVDVGYGAVRQMAAAGLSLNKLDAVFVTHHHIDHTADLSALLALRWVFKGFDPLSVVGPPGTANAVAKLIEAHRGTTIARTENGPTPAPMDSVFSGTDLPADTLQPALVYSDGTIRVFAMTNTHYHFPKGSISDREARSYGLRIETPDGVIVFTGDTGPSKNMELLAKGADMLVSEVIDLDLTARQLTRLGLPPELLKALMEHMETEHLTPSQVGEMAKAAGVKRVILSHIAPGEPGDNNEDALRAGVRSVYGGVVNVASDLERFPLGRGKLVLNGE